MATRTLSFMLPSARSCELSRLVHEGREDLRDTIDTLVIREAAHTHAHGRRRELVRNSDCVEDMRRIDASALTSRAAGCRNAAKVERHEERLTVRSGNRHVQHMRRPL